MPVSLSFRSLFTSPPPNVGVEITSRQVTAVALGRGADGPVVAKQASAALPAGVVTPALNARNIADQGAVASALRQVLEAVGRPRRIGLVLPDPVARISFVRFDTVPSRSDELDQLVRFHVKKTAPFPVDLAHLSAAPGRRFDGGAQEFVVALSRRDVVEEYEAACAAASAHAGLIDLSTCSLLNFQAAVRRRARAATGRDWMLVRLSGDYSTVAIAREDTPIFFRNRVSDAEGPLADVVHQAAMYYVDRLEGAGFERVVVAGGDAPAEEVSALERLLRERLGVAVEPLDLQGVIPMADRIGVPQSLSSVLAPPVGLVLREAAPWSA
jgi:Tfp pilus assembly PilM family ATPase